MELITAEEVSILLRCSKEFVYKNKHLLGAVKIGKLVRFRMNKIKEVISNASLPAQGEMDVRLLEERSEISKRRISHKTGSDRAGSNSAKNSESDKYGLRKIVRRAIGRHKDKKE